MSPRQDTYDVVTGKIVAALEQGVIPWEKPWRSVAGEAPTSLSTGKPYRGINTLLLSISAMAEGYSSPYWATFNQAKELAVKVARDAGREILERQNGKRSFYVEIIDGVEFPFMGGVRKGEHGTQIVLWKKAERKTKNDAGEDEKSTYAFMRHFTVFNAEQCDGLGLEAPTLEELGEADWFDPNVKAEAIVTGYIDSPSISHGGNSACYSPGLDAVRMPHQGQFKAPEYYYATLFHELAHSTGHESRLNRDGITHLAAFGAESYSKEELIAELTAAYLCAEARVEVELEHPAGYIAAWLERLQNDKKLIVSAAAAAQKASDRILGL